MTDGEGTPGWVTTINLPTDVRRVLTDPLREAVGQTLPLGKWHALPISGGIWSRYSAGCHSAVIEFGRLCGVGPESSEYQDLQIWLRDLVIVRDRVISLVLALSPFVPFDEEGAMATIASLDWRLLQLAALVEATPSASNAGGQPDLNWLDRGVPDCLDPLATGFGLAKTPRDESGEFSPAQVLASYYLRTGDLLQLMSPQLASLGVGTPHDVLVAVSTLGWILGAEDPVAAFCAMNSMLKSLQYSSLSSEEIASMLAQSRENAEVARQGRVRINQCLALAVEPSVTEEARQLALADAYKRLVEGPFRRFAWASYCLRSGKKLDTPMLTGLRDRLVAEGGWLGHVASQVVLTEIRNGEAHEHLSWDGATETFMTQGVSVDALQVRYATVVLDAFARGCDSAFALATTWPDGAETGLPKSDDLGRQPPWRRAEALFGTNGLHLVRTDLNGRVATVIVATLLEENVNPCLQALVNCHQLLPHVERFEILAANSPLPAIVVESQSLVRTYPIWERALNEFSAMPLCTFLPANFDARSHVEPTPTAVRAVAWIAVDDVLDAYSGSPDRWQSVDLALVIARVDLALLAVEQCLIALQPQDQGELLGVKRRAMEFRAALGTLSCPVWSPALESLRCVSRLRHWWELWGPVERLPGIQAEPRGGRRDHRPALHPPGWNWDLRWRTL